MAVTWKKTNFLGVRYREHKTRKHGGNRPDKCFSIRYKLNGQDKEEVIGWSSEGVTAEKAFKILSQIRDNLKTGCGPRTFAEMRQANLEAVQAEEAAQKQLANEGITFGQFWEQVYFPQAMASKKEGSCRTEMGLYKNWLEPELAHIPMRQLTASMIEKIIAKAKAKRKSPATIRYMLAVISQVWNTARREDIVEGECPTRKLKKPQKDNRRTRFLSEQEAENLLAELKLRSRDMHDIAFLSLYTGMRAGEIHALQWKNVNFQADTIEILDPKSGKNRFAIMTPEIAAMLQERQKSNTGNTLVFPGKGGKKRRWVSETFERSVNCLGFNDSGEFEEDEEGNLHPRLITDRRQKVVFHTLRHTFASWLVQRGVPLYTVAELMGHSTIEMTKRYSHLAPDTLRSAVMCLSKSEKAA